MAEPDWLDRNVPVPVYLAAPELDELVEVWRRRDTARSLVRRLHRNDIQRAAQPPVVNVMLPGVPGHFTGTPGTGQAAYVPESAG